MWLLISGEQTPLSVCHLRREKKEFTSGVVFEPLAAKGTHSLSEYARLQDTQTHLEDLRHLGLTNEEISLMLGGQEAPPCLDTGVALRLGKRTKDETESGLGADPMAQRQRLAAIEDVSHFLHLKNY